VAGNRFGIKPGANVLGPSIGVGHFFRMMPFEGKRTGVELDSISARIAQKLYPDSIIFNKGFEQARYRYLEVGLTKESESHVAN
jgi:hypothetical protein